MAGLWIVALQRTWFLTCLSRGHGVVASCQREVQSSVSLWKLGMLLDTWVRPSIELVRVENGPAKVCGICVEWRDVDFVCNSSLRPDLFTNVNTADFSLRLGCYGDGTGTPNQLLSNFCSEFSIVNGYKETRRFVHSHKKTDLWNTTSALERCGVYFSNPFLHNPVDDRHRHPKFTHKNNIWNLEETGRWL